MLLLSHERDHRRYRNRSNFYSLHPTETLTNGTIMEKRELLTKLGSNLTWNEEKLNVINRISIQTLIDGLKNTRSKKPQFEPKNIVDTSDSNEVFASVRTDLLPR